MRCKLTGESGVVSPIGYLTSMGIIFEVHKHQPIRSKQDTLALVRFPIERSIKTLAFSTPDGTLLLVAFPGIERLDYGRLAKALHIKRSGLRPADTAQLLMLGMEPGGVTPISAAGNATMVFDSQVPEMGHVYCGGGTPDQTLRLHVKDIIQLASKTVVASIVAS
jgi:Cys-tRNA(Pro)/Cys-tRNA(Cys) deacylase